MLHPCKNKRKYLQIVELKRGVEKNSFFEGVDALYIIKDIEAPTYIIPAPTVLPERITKVRQLASVFQILFSLRQKKCVLMTKATVDSRGIFRVRQR